MKTSASRSQLSANESRKLMAVDPGATTGWALFTTDSQKPSSVGECRKEDLYDWLDEYNDVEVWVVEDYIIRPPSRKQGGHEHFWDKGDTLRYIGAIQRHAHSTGAEFHKQQASLKPLAYKQMGADYQKGKKGMHIYDAIAHGAHFIGKHYM